MSGPDERRDEARKVLARHSTVRAAADELKTTSDALSALFRRVDQSASQWLGRSNVPEGHRVKGNSSLLDANGALDRRWVKTERDSSDPKFQAIPAGHHVIRTSTNVDAQGEVRQQWVIAEQAKADREAAFWEACKAHAANYTGLAGAGTMRTDTPTDEDTLTIYPLGDPHIGMLAWARETGRDFDLDIAERELVTCVEELVERAPPSGRAILANLGDFFHAQDDLARTPRGGNALDKDGRMRKVLEVGLRTERRMIDLLRRKHHRVQVFNVPGNHDPSAAQMLTLFFQEAYRFDPRVEIVDNANPYAYVEFGKNLIGICHGDGAKTEQLGAIMATDQPAAWGRTEFRYVYQGHLHHKRVVELPGCIVEVFRTLAAADAWAHWKGYRSGSSLECVTLDKEYGEIQRAQVGLKRVRAKVAA